MSITIRVNGRLRFTDAEWREAEHPRASDGKFGKGSGSQGKSAESRPSAPTVTHEETDGNRTTRTWARDGRELGKLETTVDKTRKVSGAHPRTHKVILPNGDEHAVESPSEGFELMYRHEEQNRPEETKPKPVEKPQKLPPGVELEDMETSDPNSQRWNVMRGDQPLGILSYDASRKVYTIISPKVVKEFDDPEVALDFLHRRIPKARTKAPAKPKDDTPPKAPSKPTPPAKPKGASYLSDQHRVALIKTLASNGGKDPLADRTPFDISSMSDREFSDAAGFAVMSPEGKSGSMEALKVRNAVAALPLSHRQFLGGKTSVAVTDKPIEMNSYGKQMGHSHAAGMHWAYSDTDSRIEVATHVPMPDGTRRRLTDLTGTAAHELGHALDNQMGRPSLNHPEIQKAHQEAAANIRGRMDLYTPAAEYYLKDPKEIWAETYNLIHSPTSEHFFAGFPKNMARRLVQPYIDAMQKCFKEQGL